MPHHHSDHHSRQHSPSLTGLFCCDELPTETHPLPKPPPMLLEHTFSWEDEEELASLLSKQAPVQIRPELSELRRRPAEWVLRAHDRHGFSAATAVLAVDYLGRFLSSSSSSRWSTAPWMGQLAAVACLSLAAKVEETAVPLLLDLQAEEDAFFFEARTIKRMELLVLSTLQWRMNPVTPLSFIDHISRRLEFRDQNLYLEFLRRCEDVLLSVLSDTRLLKFLPSVVAAAVVLQVVCSLEKNGLGGEECWSQLLGVLANDKEQVECCRRLISGNVVSAGAHSLVSLLRPNKRKFNDSGGASTGSPRGVVDYVCLCSDSSNDSWSSAPPPPPSVCSSSTVVPPVKKHRS